MVGMGGGVWFWFVRSRGILGGVGVFLVLGFLLRGGFLEVIVDLFLGFGSGVFWLCYLGTRFF